jgi:hypothetical protein
MPLSRLKSHARHWDGLTQERLRARWMRWGSNSLSHWKSCAMLESRMTVSNALGGTGVPRCSVGSHVFEEQ